MVRFGEMKLAPAVYATRESRRNSRRGNERKNCAVTKIPSLAGRESLHFLGTTLRRHTRRQPTRRRLLIARPRARKRRRHQQDTPPFSSSWKPTATDSRPRARFQPPHTPPASCLRQRGRGALDASARARRQARRIVHSLHCVAPFSSLMFVRNRASEMSDETRAQRLSSRRPLKEAARCAKLSRGGANV